MQLARQSLFTLALLALGFHSYAHELSSGYLTLDEVRAGVFSGELLLNSNDLTKVKGLASSDNTPVGWGQVNLNHPQVVDYLNQVLAIKRDGQTCSLAINLPSMRRISGEDLLVYPIEATCASRGDMVVNYSGIFNVESDHKLLAQINTDEQSTTKVFSLDNQSATLPDEKNSNWTLFGEMLYQGVWHIFIGIDHILFLVATLLTVNLLRANGEWQKEPSTKRIFKHTLILVSAFTLAHSITLTLTALGYISLNSNLVEFGIALSVLFTAINNIYPQVVKLGILTFAFGLLHGMGFASVFADLNAQSDSLVLSVAAFNIGVEVGQLAIVSVILPLLIGLRHWQQYARAIMPLASSVIAIIALNWAIQRW
ncbi:HupE/UreJ family protein [Alteromonas sp. 345S023]|uniref:HupE/UreJ family protein n=1 Tax=Alteromonas profundi TaxID=2696062 RepID=A0A7X5RJY0_9ALTE|nr:HupE/UreJ family protein [Alteromonas profundi]